MCNDWNIELHMTSNNKIEKVSLRKKETSVGLNFATHRGGEGDEICLASSTSGGYLLFKLVAFEGAFFVLQLNGKRIKVIAASHHRTGQR